MKATASRPTRQIQSRGLVAWPMFFLIVPLVGWLSTSYSKDYSIYLDLITNQEATDPLFEAYIAVGALMGLSASAVYLLFLTTLIAALVYYFASRRISCYWISIYVFSFGLLHVVTQVRAGMASVVIAILLTSSRRWVRLLTPIGIAIHASAVLFIGTGFARTRPWLIVLFVVAPLGGIVLYGIESEKLVQYAVEVNESQAVSVALAAYCVTLFVVLVARLPLPTKVMLVTVGVLTIGVYYTFIDLKAISNRFVELSHAVSLMLLGALDSPRGATFGSKARASLERPIVPRWLKVAVLITTIQLFYVSNIQNSILNF